MNTSFAEIRRGRMWRFWCNEKVVYDMLEDVPRKLLITELVNNGIVPMFKTAGYTFACNNHRISECIAQYIYHGRVYHEVLNWDYREQDYNHYYYVLDDELWDDFWSYWARWSDVEDVKTQAGIQFCLWTLLDLYKSPATTVVDDILGLNDEENMQANKEDTRDPYLIDSANGYFSAI